MGVATMANTNAPYVKLVGHVLDSKHAEASLLQNSTDLLCLQLAQVPRSPDLVVSTTTTTTTTKQITLLLAHARRVIKQLCKHRMCRCTHMKNGSC